MQALHYLSQVFSRTDSVASVSMLENGVLVRTAQGDSIIIYLLATLDSPQPPVVLLEHNSAAHRHSLFVINGELLTVESFGGHSLLLILYRLYRGKLYAYKLLEDMLYILPVYLEWTAEGKPRAIRYGMPVDLARIKCRWVEHGVSGRQVRWAIAEFEGQQFEHPNLKAERFARQNKALTSRQREILKHFYLALGLTPLAGEDDIRRAYRRLAKRYHPDSNPSSGAKARMQAINEAYRYLMKQYK